MAFSANEALAASTKIGPVYSLDRYREAIALVRKRNSVAVVDVGAEWCAFCHTLDNKILRDPKVADMLSNLGFIRIDVTAMTAENQELLKSLAVDGPPTVFLVDASTGQELPATRSVGSFSVENLMRRLRPFVAGRYTPEHSPARLARPS